MNEQNDIQAHGDRKTVVIKIDNKRYEVKKGTYTVLELKQIGGVDPAYDLLEQKHGKLVPLDDNGKTHIEGGECFFSQPKSGASS